MSGMRDVLTMCHRGILRDGSLFGSCTLHGYRYLNRIHYHEIG